MKYEFCFRNTLKSSSCISFKFGMPLIRTFNPVLLLDSCISSKVVPPFCVGINTIPYFHLKVNLSVWTLLRWKRRSFFFVCFHMLQMFIRLLHFCYLVLHNLPLGMGLYQKRLCRQGEKVSLKNIRVTYNNPKLFLVPKNDRR